MPKSKSKKRKLAHQHHPYNKSNPTQELSHEEIWDDSALLRSWDDAVAEYEFYHSIHAKGEDVDDVLARYAAENGEEEGELDEEDGEVIEGEDDRVNVAETTDQLLEPTPVDPEPNRPASDAAATTLAQPTEPMQTQPSSQAEATGPDQTLENLKMAYYWAGYYSGLHDGQGQAQTATAIPAAQAQATPSTAEKEDGEV